MSLVRDEFVCNNALLRTISGLLVKQKWSRVFLTRQSTTNDSGQHAPAPAERRTYSPLVLAWTTNAIALAGYDPRNMLTEWHIFWRRKGV